MKKALPFAGWLLAALLAGFMLAQVSPATSPSQRAPAVQMGQDSQALTDSLRKQDEQRKVDALDRQLNPIQSTSAGSKESIHIGR